MKKTVLLIATFDTKGREAQYLKQCIESQGLSVLTLDAGILEASEISTDIDRKAVAQRGGIPLDKAVSAGDKGACVLNMMHGVEACCKELADNRRIDGVIGIGGEQGTDIACSGMRVLPIGMPKLMVSTVASGKTPFGALMPVSTRNG